MDQAVNGGTNGINGAEALLQDGNDNGVAAKMRAVGVTPPRAISL